MCGIAGYWRPPGLDTSGARAAMAGALERMRLRGPDDHGTEIYEASWGELAFGHTRLSVIDLSANGHQPMTSIDGRYTLAYNGEIYNYLELRQELIAAGHSFRSQSDTEVLLAAWSHWGPACLPRLVGIFAFAVFDREQETLSCARDAFGIKPFLYAAQPGQFCFASEVAALVVLRGQGATLNHQRVYDYLVYGDYDSSENTFVQDIRQLPPASWMRVDLRRGVANPPVRWWNPSLAQRDGISFDDAAARLREIFLRNVRLQLRSDVPLGAALSGGIDSSAVVCAMRHMEPDLPIHTFSFLARDSEVSEESWINLINQHVQSQSHLVEVAPSELARDLDDMIRTQGEPFGSTSIYAQYRVFKLAREHGVTVTLDGQGADELLGGYAGYPGQRVTGLLQQGEYLRAARFLRNWSQWPDRSLAVGLRLFATELFGGEMHEKLSSLRPGFQRPPWLRMGELSDRGVVARIPNLRPMTKLRGRHLVSELAWSCHHRGLLALLRHGDRNSMRFSVESRVPFLTCELADFMFGLPEHYLVSDQGETKSVFRSAMRGLVPDAVLDRRDKIGFATPELGWLRALRPQLRQWLGDAEGVTFLDRRHMGEVIDQTLDGHRPFSLQIWRWINFLRWHELVFGSLAQR